MPASPPIILGPVGGADVANHATGEKAIFIKFVNDHKSLRPYANAIWQAAGRYGGITPTELAAVIYRESGGNKDAKSKVGALGLAQIYDNSASATNAAGVPFFRQDHNISSEDKTNPAFAIQYAAWRLSGYASTHGGSIDDTWVGGYNPNYKSGVDGPANPITSLLPKGYVGTASSTPDQKAGASVDTTDISNSLRDPWVTGVSKNGKLIVKAGAVAPGNTVMYDGLPMRASDFKSLSRQLDTYFRSYTGGGVNPATVLQYVKKGWSPYTLTVALAKSPKFATSPIYKKYAPEYQDVAKDLLGPGESTPQKLITAGILNGWDQGTFAAVVRKLPGYVQSNEFKENEATLTNVHQSIMGIPDENAQLTINQATAAGWKADQYAAWLRSQPTYTQSPEYQSKALSFLGALGLITGQNPVLKKGTVPASQNPYGSTNTEIPTDPRLMNAQPLKPAEDTIPTY